jgi:carbon storage regulator CsrA
MLVLQRKVGETIVIGDNIEVTVIDVGSSRTRLGFRCPSDVKVLRGELRRFDVEVEVPRPRLNNPRPRAVRRRVPERVG